MRLSQLLPLRQQMRLGKAIGRLAMKLVKGRVNTAKRNIELCFPQMSAADQAVLLTQNFEETGKAIFDIANAWWWPDSKVQQHMTIKGQAHVEQTLAAGQGVILFAVHCLPLEMGARIFGQFQPGIGVYRPHNNPLMEYLQVNGRLRSNKGLVAKRDIRQMVRSLRSPDVIWYTADQDFGRSSAVFIPFFAVPDAATITGATTLAKLGKAKVLPLPSSATMMITATALKYRRHWTISPVRMSLKTPNVVIKSSNQSLIVIAPNICGYIAVSKLDQIKTTPLYISNPCTRWQ